MPEFTDRSGRVWQVCPTLLTLRRVKERTGCDIANACKPGNEAMQRLSDDVALLADVLFVIIQETNQAGDMTGEQFAELLDGDVLDAGRDALVDAVIDFFPKTRREAIREMLKATGEAQGQAAELMREPKMREKLKATIRTEMERALNSATSG